MASSTLLIAEAKSAITSSITERRLRAASSAASRCRVIALATSKEMSWETSFVLSASLAGENRYLRASASTAARSR